MRKGFGIITLLLGIGLFVLLGSGVAAATIFVKKDASPPKNNLSNSPKNDKDKSMSENNTELKGASPSPASSTKPTTQNLEATPQAAQATNSSTLFEQPAKLYKITIPSGWIKNSTLSTGTYSTTTFSGPSGNISITFGSGKDPIGGCSDSVALKLSDRIIPACFLLRKDGSRLISRGYTKSSGNLEITIEGYVNAPLKDNEQAVLSVIETIDII